MIGSDSPLWLLLVLTLLSGFAGALLTIILRAWQDKREIKRDVLRRLAGHRHVVSKRHPDLPPNGEPFVALNEAFIVFAEDPEVLQALQDLRTHDGKAEHVVALIKRMASAAGVAIKPDDAFISAAFTPRIQTTTAPPTGSGSADAPAQVFAKIAEGIRGRSSGSTP